MSRAPRPGYVYLSLPDALVDDVNAILHPRRLTKNLFRAFAEALDGYGSRQRNAASRAAMNQSIDAVRRLITTATTLQREMRRADAAFPIKGEWFLPSHWEPLGPPLQGLIDELHGWLALQASGPRQRGNPHDGQDVFRGRVLGALQDAGFRITNPRGQAARVLARLLEEIDRRDGKPSRERTDFSGQQWARWVEHVQFIDALIADRKRSPHRGADWYRIRFPVFAREWAAARKATKRKRG